MKNFFLNFILSNVVIFIKILMFICVILISACSAVPIYSQYHEQGNDIFPHSDISQNTTSQNNINFDNSIIQNDKTRWYNSDLLNKCSVITISNIEVVNQKREPNVDSKIDSFAFFLKENIEQKVQILRGTFIAKLSNIYHYDIGQNSKSLHHKNLQNICPESKTILLIQYNIKDEHFFLQKQAFAARNRIFITFDYELLGSSDLMILQHGKVNRILSYLVPKSSYGSLLSYDDILNDSIADVADEIIHKLISAI